MEEIQPKKWEKKERKRREEVKKITRARDINTHTHTHTHTSRGGWMCAFYCFFSLLLLFFALAVLTC
jgi:hypothetical protein